MNIDQHSRIKKSLEAIVGEDFVSDNEEELFFYSSDPSSEPPCKPEFVVMPKTAKEIQKIVKLANIERVPITPRAGGMTVAGLAIPCGEDILLDLKRMNRIIEVNEKSMYAVVECGVTIGQFKTYLEENYLDLEYSIPAAPPSVSVVANTLVWGTGILLLKYGPNSDMINGLEVVLPTGGILKTGSCALASSWFSKYCIPNLSGLFIGWFGSTGIVTKCSIQLWPKPKIRSILRMSIDDPDDVPELILKLARQEVAEKISVGSWTDNPERFNLKKKPKGIPELFMFIYVSGNSQDECDIKQNAIETTVKEEQKNGRNITLYKLTDNETDAVLSERPAPELPMDSYRRGGGYEYLGAHIPIKQFGLAYKEGARIAKKHGFQFIQGLMVIRPGHSGIFTFVFPFNRTDQDEVRRLRLARIDLCKLTLRLGGTPWKPTPSEQKIVLQRADPSFVKLMKRIKSVLDPNRVMSPNKWV